MYVCANECFEKKYLLGGQRSYRRCWECGSLIIYQGELFDATESLRNAQSNPTPGKAEDSRSEGCEIRGGNPGRKDCEPGEGSEKKSEQLEEGKESC